MKYSQYIRIAGTSKKPERPAKAQASNTTVTTTKRIIVGNPTPQKVTETPQEAPSVVSKGKKVKNNPEKE